VTYVKTLEGAKPPQRFDSVPFTTARFQESATDAGPWTTVQTFPLSPVDPDPSDPLARDLTTSLAALEAGWYRVQWVDSGNATTNSVPVRIPSSDLATADDVARVLQLDPESIDENAVSAALAVATSWVRRYLKSPNLGVIGETTESFFDVREGGDFAATGEVTSVSVVDWAGGTARLLGPSEWTHDGYRVRLRPDYAVTWGDGGWEEVSAERVGGRSYVRVDVTSTQDGDVDPVIREATALAAAALFTRGPRLGKGLQSESIGDYSYTVSQLGEEDDPFFREAKTLLRPLIRRQSLVP
jgi:hypothetical protein